MPLPMVHLGVAKKIADSGKFKITNLPDFYLGNIAPDGIHMRDGWVPEDKQASHLYMHAVMDISKRDDLLNNIANFVKGIEGEDNRDYLLGYAVHILTDGYFNEYVYKKFFKKYNDDENPIQDVRMAYYNDTDQLDFVLYHTLEGRQEIWTELEKSKGHDVKDILFTQEAEKWRDRTLHWYDNESEHSNPIKYITVEQINDFIDTCAELCEKFIGNIINM